MDRSTGNRNTPNAAANQPQRKTSNQNDLLAKIRPVSLNKPNLVQQLAHSTPIQVSSGLKILSTRIQPNADPSYQPLVTISDDDDNRTDEEDFVSPVHRLTRNELREELRTFRQHDDSANTTTNQALLLAEGGNDEDDDDVDEIEFRRHQTVKRAACCSQYPFCCRVSACILS